MNKIKSYRTFSDELKRIFGCKVQRISIDVGGDCPNRDGTVGEGGCIFCGGHGSGSFGIKRGLTIAEQLEDGKEIMRRKYKAAKFLAYFQAYTTTHTSLQLMQSMLDQACQVEDVVGTIVATRPDCLSDQVLDCLADCAVRTCFWLEIGMQTSHDHSLRFLNRCHDHAVTIDAVRRAHERGLKVCLHLIVGIPGESRDDLMATVHEVNRLGVAGVKLHLLHVMKGTQLEKLYQRGELAILERDQYVGLVCDMLEALDPSITIHRLTGDGGHDNLVAPLWSLKKFEVLNLIDAEMTRRCRTTSPVLPLSFSDQTPR